MGRKRLIKNLVVILTLTLFLSSCTLKERFQEFKEDNVERVKVFLSNLPLVRKYVSLHSPPKELYQEIKGMIEWIKGAKVPDLYKEEHKAVLKEWERIEGYYKKKYYKKCERELKRFKPKVETLKNKLETYRETLKKEAMQKYQAVEQKAKEILKNKKGEERLRIELYLWKLRSLIALEDYEKFNQEIENAPF
ncbi:MULTISPECIES: hypothetical protein [Thermodesulfobacterium]|jgi:gas vesicle protein|uniref:Lipoprotein n=1 Tax=Thermodesulfobacterium commune DSM 2178 TaxID=289377 RepID=A0A075WSN5_9BACT|nr:MULTISPECIES: hypothetical protein [Thermodesulfobacterium]AIH04025.1 hypothetical protein HL41_04145 [Thermodesulfobacterium commune DSM 2178]MBZ4681401.1 hypothetical protein [Thermodesulfobacterium sp.]MDN5379542.1 hypothetical protein [Thermodesulfobacterium sp.]